MKVPPLDPRDPSVKFKEKGRSRLTVEVLVASKDSRYRVEFVPELECHVAALPYFRYLVSETQPAIVMSRLGCASVRVPLPERFAMHKLLVAQLRTDRGEKSLKDRRQAAGSQSHEQAMSRGTPLENVRYPELVTSEYGQ